MYSFVFVLSAFFCLAHSYSVVSNPSRWMNYGNNRYYVDPVFKGNFYAGIEFCERNQMEAVAIESVGEMEAIYKFLKGLSGTKVQGYYTSGSRLSNGKDYKYLATGKPVSVSKWGPGEPNNGGGAQKCLQLFINYFKNGEFFDDISCDTILPVLCKSRGQVIIP